MSTNKQAPHETFRGTMIADCVAAGIDMGLAKDGDAVPAVVSVVAGFMAMRLDRYVEMLESLVDGEDLVRVQILIAERYKVSRRTEA